MSDIPVMAQVGRDLGRAIEAGVPRVRRRRRLAALAAVLSVAAAAPAVGTVTDWAGLAGGETALPTQVDPSLRAPLAVGATSRGGPFRLEVYRALLTGPSGTVGLCVFVTGERGGTGRCAPEPDVPALIDAGTDVLLGVAAGAVEPRVVRVELRTRRYDGARGRVAAVVPADPVEAPGGREVRGYVLALDRDEIGVLGVRALDADGRTVATAGKPAPPRSEARAQITPNLKEDAAP